MSERHLETIYASAPRGARTSHPSGQAVLIGGWERQPKEVLTAIERGWDAG